MRETEGLALPPPSARRREAPSTDKGEAARRSRAGWGLPSTEKESGVQTKQETFVWCGSRFCQKRASNGTTVVRSYFGEGFEESGPTKYFYTRDHLGSVREVVGGDGASVASRLSYDPWGKVTETGTGALSDITYTGHYADRAIGLNLAQYRAYDAQVARWISRDPLGLRGGPNFYGYVNNEPISGVDPDGLAVVRLQNPLGRVFAWLAQAGDWNLSQAEQCAGSGNYGGAAMYGFFGAALLVIEALAVNLPDVVNLALLGVEQPPGFGKAPQQVTPGTRVLEGVYYNDVGQGFRSEPWRAHYDQYGRLIGRTDFNAGNSATGVPEVHHHAWEYGPGYSPSGHEYVKHAPGEYLPK